MRPQCTQTTAEGTRCRNRVFQNLDLCYAHGVGVSPTSACA